MSRVLSNLSAPLVARLMMNDLRNRFDSVTLSGEPLPSSGPLILFCNHNYFHDGYLMWMMLRHHGRTVTTWMEELDQFPFFVAQGALPFPKDDEKRRFKTMRQTVARLRDVENHALFYFPTGDLQPANQTDSFGSDRVERIRRLIPEASVHACGIRVSMETGTRPTARIIVGKAIGIGEVRGSTDLDELLVELDQHSSEKETVLLTGKTGPESRWNFSLFKNLFIE